MPMTDCIHACILIEGQPAQEYVDPGVEESSHQFTRYIEVAVVNDGLSRFAPYLYAFVQVDDGHMCHSGHIASTNVEHHHGHLTRDYIVLNHGKNLAWDNRQGGWVHYWNTIGALGISEEGPIPAGITPESFSKMGSIRVTFFRAKQVRKAQAYVHDGNLPRVLDEVPETVAKGTDVKANTKFVLAGAALGPNPIYYDHVPINGKHGKPYEFIFKYRSRKALQNLGLIERSPSPQPDLGLQLERAQAEADDARREIKKLRAQLPSGSAASSVTVKAEPGSTTSGRQPARGQLKRERGEDDDADDVVEVAPLPKKPKVVIDLTWDD